jgi:hypothetical protein
MRGQAAPAPAPAFAISPVEAHTVSKRVPAPPAKAPKVPVDPLPAARVVAPMRHVRKLAFVFGAGVTLLALYLLTQIPGWPS